MEKSRDNAISTWPTLANGAKDQEDLRQLRRTALLMQPAYQMSGQLLKDWVRDRWGSPALLDLGLDDLLTEQNDGISRRVFELMANDANAPAEVFREYKLMKRRLPRRMGGEWDIVDGRETFVREANEMTSLQGTPCERSDVESVARSVQGMGTILLPPSEAASSGTTIYTPNDDESEAGTWSRYGIPRPDSFSQSTIKGTEAVKEQKRSMCEEWLSVTYP